MLTIRTIDQLPLRGKRVLVRVDYNIPRDPSGAISDDRRVRQSLSTLLYLLDQEASIILISHFGDPKEPSESWSLQEVARTLSGLIGQKVRFFSSCIGEEVEKVCKKMRPKEIFLLENLRFHPGEKAGDEIFASSLAALADFFLLDAFASAHRNHASTVKLPKLFGERSAAGFLMERETRFLTQHLLNPPRPMIAVVGGAKISSKIGILEKLLEKCDALAIVGAMSFTFFKAKGFAIGQSLYEEDFLERAIILLKRAEERGKQLLLPLDLLVSDDLHKPKNLRVVRPQEGISPAGYGVDIAELTIGSIYEMLQRGKTLFWNGPAGIFEVPQFSFGTKAIANIFASHPHTTVVGGGDSCAALKMCQVEDKIDHISTGGGACLELIEKETLPGIEAISTS